jgi:16S rRNA processing protein RimM
VLAPHGIRGELKCRVVTDFPKQRFKRGNMVVIEGVTHTIESARLSDRVVLLKVDRVDDRDAAERLRNKEVQIRTEDAVALPKGQFYWHQVIGLSVIDASSNAELGRVADILETGANDVYVVQSGNQKEILVPAIKDVILAIEPEAGRMVIAPLPGMIRE